MRIERRLARPALLASPVLLNDEDQSFVHALAVKVRANVRVETLMITHLFSGAFGSVLNPEKSIEKGGQK
jgi:hypothetical protein